MKKPVLSLLGWMLLAAPVAAEEACEVDLRPTFQLCADVHWVEGPHINKGPRENQTSTVSVSFWNPEGSAQVKVAPPEKLMIVPWMDMDGHSHGTYFVETRQDKAVVLSEMRLSEMGPHPWLILFVSKDDPFLESGHPKPFYTFVVEGSGGGGAGGGHHDHSHH